MMSRIFGSVCQFYPQHLAPVASQWLFDKQGDQPFQSIQRECPPHFVFFFFFHLFLFVGGWLLYNIVVGFAIHWHESAMDLHVFPILNPPPTSLPIPSLWVIPVHQPWALVSCIQPGLVICFTLDSILVAMLFSQNFPPSPSPTESQSLFCTSVPLFLFCILGYHYHLFKFTLEAQCLGPPKWLSSLEEK